VTEAAATIVDEIASLLAEPEPGTARPSLASIEYTLTSGYARALELEAERWRLDRRIGEVTSLLAASDGDGDAGAEELAALTARASTADGELRHLRGLLEALRSRASALRAAGAAVTL
jgi:hypothetical protein